MLIEYITKAIEIEEEIEKRKRFLAAFYNDKAEVQFLQKNRECLITLEKAIENQETDKTKNSWRGKLKTWTDELV